ncbi:magnesium transporter [Vibrio chaetopteri]|uniref:Magnesium transporter n=1 Tax=Vibrio chaetopteri TaxID=3016528 RepID=A0AAU8BPR9_9VIBR
MLEQSGVFGGDESRTMLVLKRNLRRLTFLMPSVALSYAAISIIAMYEPIIEQIAVLAAVLPLVANLSGAAGNQSVTVSIRELSLGQISTKDLLYVVAKEIPIGALVLLDHSFTIRARFDSGYHQFGRSNCNV